MAETTTVPTLDDEARLKRRWIEREALGYVLFELLRAIDDSDNPLTEIDWEEVSRPISCLTDNEAADLDFECRFLDRNRDDYSPELDEAQDVAGAIASRILAAITTSSVQDHCLREAVRRIGVS